MGLRPPVLWVVFLAFTALALAGCDRNARKGATGPLPEQRSKDSPASTGGLTNAVTLPGNSSFLFNFVALGCVLPSGEFKTFHFMNNGARINNGKSLEIAALVPLQNGGHSLQGTTVRQDFLLKRDVAMTESHVFTLFDDGEKPFTCLLLTDGGYVSNLSIVPGMEAMAGQWNCAGDIGPIVFVSDGHYAQTNTNGRLVLSSPKQQAADMKIYLLGGLRKDFWSPAVSALSLDASALNAGLIFINKQECKRS